MRIFISYARADGLAYAEKIEQELLNAGIEVWRDKRDIDPDQDFTAQIEDAIETATHVLVCITPDSKRQDSFVRREIQYALLSKPPKSILPLRFADIPPHIHIDTHSWIDCFDRDWSAVVTDLLDFLKRPFKVSLQTTHYSSGDLYHEHVEQLLYHVIDELRLRVFDLFHVDEVVQLRSNNKPDAVSVKRVPVAYLSKIPPWLKNKDEAKIFTTFIDAFAYHRQRLLLLGEPGAGKTTTLLTLARDTAYARLENPSSLLPVYAPAYTWSLGETISDWLARITDLSSAALQTLIRRRQILLLIDGLDELAYEVGQQKNTHDYCVEFIQALAEISPTPTLVTCRVRDYEQIVARGNQKIGLQGAVELGALTDEQVENYLRDQGRLYHLIREDTALRQMVRTPLLLSLLAAAFRDMLPEAQIDKIEGQTDERLRAHIFESYLLKRYQFEEVKMGGKPLPFSLNEMKNILSQMALLAIPVNLQGANYELGENEIELQTFQKLLDAKALPFTELAVQLHILLPVSSKRFRFLHLLMRDYFAQLYLKRLQDKDQEAWETMITYYSPYLRGAIRSSLNQRYLPPDLVDEIEQQTWATAGQKIIDFKFTGMGRLYYWLRIVSKNHVRNEGRNRNIDSVHLDEIDENAALPVFDADFGLEETYIQKDAQKTLMDRFYRALDTLTEMEREIAVRRLINREPVEDISLALGIRVNTVYQITQRIKKKIRTFLNGDE